MAVDSTVTSEASLPSPGGSVSSSVKWAQASWVITAHLLSPLALFILGKVCHLYLNGKTMNAKDVRSLWIPLYFPLKS